MDSPREGVHGPRAAAEAGEELRSFGSPGSPGSPAGTPAPEAFYIGEDGDHSSAAAAAAAELPAESLVDYADQALELVGSNGAFQSRYTVLLTIPWVVCGMQTMAGVFTTMPPDIRRSCYQQTDHCDTSPLIRPDCAHRLYFTFTQPHESLISDFELFCDASFLVPLLGTIFFLGFLLGVTILGARADSHGRRSAYLWSMIFLQSGALVVVLAGNYALYAIGRFITGFGIGGLGLCAYVWNAEVLGPQSRSNLVVTSNVGFALGVALLSPLSYWVVTWRRLSGCLFGLGLPISFVYLLLESPKWLAARGDAAGLERVLARMAAVNGRPPPPPPPAPREDSGGQCTDAKVTASQMIQQLLLDPRLSRRFLVMCFSWFAVSLGYYGISMNVSHIGGSIYIASAMSALVEVPAYVFAIWAVETAWAGRRGTTLGGLVLGGLCCVLCVAAEGESSEKGPAGARGTGSQAEEKVTVGLLVLVFVGKFAVALSFSVIYLYAAELFPTDVRSRSMGLQSLSARLGGMLAPMVADLGKTSQSLPMVLFGVPCIAAGLLMMGLPETRGQPMANTVKELQQPGVWPCVRLCVPSYQELDEESRTPGNRPAPEKVGNTM